MLTTIEHIKEILQVSKALIAEKINPFIEDAENIISDTISEDFYNELDSGSSSNEITIKLIDLLRKSIAYLTWYLGFDIMNASFSNQGIHRIESDKTKSLFQRQEENLKETFKIQGYNKLDRALRYLEKNKGSFNTWTSSDEYTLSKRNFINSTKQFNSISIIRAWCFLNYARLKC